MSKILIFTNCEKASGIDFYENCLEFPSSKKPLFFFSYNNGKVNLKSVEKCSESGIYLVFDGYEDTNYDKTFDTLLNQCEGEDLYILVHSLPSRKNDFVKHGFRVPVEGMHEPGWENYYYPIFDILADEQNDKMTRIIHLLRPLESKELLETALFFFDGCLNAGNNEPKFVEAINVLKKDKEFGEDIKSFYENQYKRNGIYREYMDYFQDLISLIERVKEIINGRIMKEKHTYSTS